MINFLAATKNVWNNLIEMLQDPLVIIGMAFMAIGIAIICLSTRIARTMRKTKIVAQNDSVKIMSRVIGVVMLLGGFVLVLVSCITTLT